MIIKKICIERIFPVTLNSKVLTSKLIHATKQDNAVSSGRFKSKETDFVDFFTRIHNLRYVNPIFMFFMSKNPQHSVVLDFFFTKIVFFISFDGVKLKKKQLHLF